MRELIAGIWADDWDRPTALDGFAVSDLVEHVCSGVHQFSQLAAGHDLDLDAKVNVNVTGVVVRFDEIIAESLIAWGEPSALTNSYGMPWGQELGERLVAYLIIETAGHAWDLGGALGHEIPMSDALAEAVLEVARSFSEETLRAPGMFAQEQPVADDATQLEELVSFLGRKIS
ncbi:MAG: TIGR03086 family protein [bacterium]|nr:TIGR03086 family protein [bacterium]